MRYSTSGRDISYWLFKDRIPVTKLLIVLNAFTFLAVGIFKIVAIGAVLVFTTDKLFLAPWTALTYPILTLEPISLLFSCWWLWWAAGSLERAWGSTRFGIFFFANAVITALGLYLGTHVLNAGPQLLAGLWMPLAGVTIAFAMMDPEQQIMFYFVIPMKMKYLALFDVILVLFNYKFPLGLFALAGCAFSYFYIRRPSFGSSRSHRTHDGDIRVHLPHSRPSILNPSAWYRDYQERRRLKKFLGKSNFPDV